jgi:thymidylate synthase (FAD)
MVAEGIPAEDARYLLPNAATTNIIVTMNARELLHFFALRCCERAQWEIRAMSVEMLRLVKVIAPVIFRDAGPGCVAGLCPEGTMTCGKASAIREQFRSL